VTESRSPSLDAIYALLADGHWVDGQVALREGMRAIPPGLASRHHRLDSTRPLNERVESGKREIARESMASAIRRGRLAVDVPEVTRAHWRGDLPWRVRDAEAGMLSVADVAEMLGIPSTTARVWIKHGYVPQPATNAAGILRVTPDQLRAWKLVREAWPGPSAQWTVSPRSLWATAPSLRCPHCHEPIEVTVTKAIGE
jgi:hypothetical protein